MPAMSSTSTFSLPGQGETEVCLLFTTLQHFSLYSAIRVKRSGDGKAWRQQ